MKKLISFGATLVVALGIFALVHAADNNTTYIIGYTPVIAK